MADDTQLHVLSGTMTAPEANQCVSPGEWITR